MEQDPVGLSQLAFSHILCFSSSLKYLLNIYVCVCVCVYTFEAHVLSCFTGVNIPHQMEDVNLLMTMNTKPQASWSLRTDSDTPLLPHHQPVRELCMS